MTHRSPKPDCRMIVARLYRIYRIYQMRRGRVNRRIFLDIEVPNEGHELSDGRRFILQRSHERNVELVSERWVRYPEMAAE